MPVIDDKIKECVIEVRAGPGGENSDVYRWIHSPTPDWAKTVDDPTYRKLTTAALEAATKIVRYSGQHITLKLSVENS